MLNKNGWGYREFLIGGAILLIALLFATFFIIRLYSGLPNLNTFIVDPVDYQDIENSVKTASLKYISNYYREDIGDGVIVISTDNLKKYDLITDTDLTETNNNDSCKGYALVRNKDNMVTSDAYINCKNYASEGYQAWRLVDNG